MTRLAHSLLLTSLLSLGSVAFAPAANAQGLFVGIGFGGPYTPAPPRVWVPGHYEVVLQTVWVPGCTRQVWVAPVYSTYFDACGRPFQVCVRPGHWKNVYDAGRYESRRVRMWVEGYWR